MTGSAHGKILLLGEHSVVYGHKAISLPISALNTTCTLKESDENTFDSALYTGHLNALPEALHPFKRLIEALQNHYQSGAFIHTLISTMPIGAGFGSSAAAATAIVRAYDATLGLNLSKETLFDWVQSFETMVHELPSGIDALTVIHDQGFVFSKSHKTPLNLTLGAYLVIADTKTRTPTKTSVAHVARHKTTPQFKTALSALGGIAIKGETAIAQKDLESLGSLMNQSMTWLREMALSTPSIEKLIATANAHGSIGTKLTGGGLGGCIIALCETRKDAQNIERALKDLHGAPTWIAKI